LTGQVVRAIRQTGLSRSGEMQWVIEMEDKARFAIPLSWAEEVNVEQGVSKIITGAGILADTKAYLELAKMIQRIKMNQPEEVQPHETSSLCTPVVSAEGSTEEGKASHSSTDLERITPTTTAGNDFDSGKHAGQTASKHSAKKWRAK
jgi:hypothetical protein